MTARRAPTLISCLCLLACAAAAGCDDAAPIDAAPIDAAPIDAAPIDAAAGDGNFAGLGEVCGSSALDAGTPAACAPGLACCYPCGIPGCAFTCTEPCDGDAGPACSGGCLAVP